MGATIQISDTPLLVKSMCLAQFKPIFRFESIARDMFDSKSYNDAKIVENFADVKIAKSQVGINAFEFRQDSNGQIFKLEWDKISCLLEHRKPAENVYEIVKKLFDTSLTALKVKETRQIGFRNLFWIPVSGEYQDLVEHYKTKFYKSNNPISDLGEIKDVGIDGFNLEQEGFRINIIVGPYSKAEFIQKLAVFENLERPYLIGNGIGIDIDIITTGPSMVPVAAVLNKMEQHSVGLATKFVEDIK